MEFSSIVGVFILFDIIGVVLEATVSSRLKSLIARSFKAEKLYAAMYVDASEVDEASDPIRAVSSSLKSKEWANQYKSLRVALNRISRLRSSAEIFSALFELKAEFSSVGFETKKEMFALSNQVSTSTKREEYGKLVNISSKLLVLKAKLQAAKLIEQDLFALLEQSFGKKKVSEHLKKQEQGVLAESVAVPSDNVISFRRVAGRSR